MQAACRECQNVVCDSETDTGRETLSNAGDVLQVRAGVGEGHGILCKAELKAVDAELTQRFAKNLKRALLSRNMTVEELADKLELTAETIEIWMRGKRGPKLDNFFKLSRALRLPMDYFYRRGK